MRKIEFLLPLAAAALAAACADSATAVRTPGALVAVSGNAQQGTVHQALPLPVVVQVTDVKGKPIGGREVIFTVASGGGSVAHDTVSSDAQGNAADVWTLGTGAGDQVLEARVDGAPSVAPVDFHATAMPGPATQFLQPAPQLPPLGYRSTFVGTKFPLAVVVGDAFGNVVPGATVTWQVSKGTGSVSPAQSVADANGQASTVWTIGAYDTNNSANEVTASLASGATYVFLADYTRHVYTAVVTPASPDTMVLHVGDDVTVGVSIHDETGATFTPTGYDWVWTSSSAAVQTPAIVQTSTSATLHAAAPGTATVTVASLPPGGRDDPQFTASKVIVVQ